MKRMAKMLALVLTLGLTLGSAISTASVLAKSDNANANKSNNQQEQKATANTADKDSDAEDSVTEATYGDHGHKGYIGLQKALLNVADKPAGEVIAELLAEKYGLVDILAQLKAEAQVMAAEDNSDSSSLEKLKEYAEKLREQLDEDAAEIAEKDAALSDLAELYAVAGDLQVAADVQKEAIQINKTNLELYKKLGKIYDKLGKKGIKTFVNGAEQTFDVSPVIKNDRTLVPYRGIAESLQATVDYDPETKTVTVTKGDIVVTLMLGSTTATINGEEVSLDVPGQLIQNRTFVPIRFLIEALNADVKWEPESKTVIVVAE